MINFEICGTVSYFGESLNWENYVIDYKFHENKNYYFIIVKLMKIVQIANIWLLKILIYQIYSIQSCFCWEQNLFKIHIYIHLNNKKTLNRKMVNISQIFGNSWNSFHMFTEFSHWIFLLYLTKLVMIFLPELIDKLNLYIIDFNF